MADTLELEADLAADKDLFSPWLSGRGRKWFVEKIVAHSSTAADVPAQSKQYLQQAKSIIDARPDRPREYAAAGTHLDIEELLVRILYASLGTHPAVFLDQTHSDLLTFVAERRLRSILQMRDFVNPTNRHFAFPVDLLHSKLRSTQTHWEGVNLVGTEKLWPFVLKPAATVDRKQAVEELFKVGRAANSTDFNFVDCQTAASMVLLDSLMEADDPKKLFDSLDAEAGGYLAVDMPDTAFRLIAGVLLGGLNILQQSVTPNANVVLQVIPPAQVEAPFSLVLLSDSGVSETVSITNVENPVPKQLLKTGVSETPDNIAKALIRTAAAPLFPSKLTAAQLNGSFDRGTRALSQGIPTFHFLTDPRPQKGLFEQGLVPIEDLQPGDVVHVLGHPLTRSKIPTSPFGGERCVMVDPWALPQYLISITGHGVGVSDLNDLALHALIGPNRLLTVARQVLEGCLGPMMEGLPAASGQFNDADNDVLEIIGRGLNVAPSRWLDPGFFIDGSWEVHNFPAIADGDLDWWAELGEDPLGKFPGYPQYWALTAEGHINLPGLGILEFKPGDFFAFGYWPNERVTSDLTWDTIVNRNFVGLLRTPFLNPTSTDQSLQYVIPYFDDQAGLTLFMPLYDKVPDDTAIPTVLTYSDLAPHLFNLADNDTEAWVLRPRVSADPGYLTHLRTIGALPAAP